jgi:uncharacterized membrane protein YeaQ/YmgE (transglycosylase-associated protein family)
MHPLLRGVIIGGCIGLMATWFGLDPVRAFFLGMICGLLAAYTANRLQQRRKK